MALQKNTETKIGLALTNAYIRIDKQSGTKEQIDLRVRTYVSREAKDNLKQWADESIYSFVPLVDDGSVNFIKQGYEYLKTLPEFLTAIDV